MVNMNEIEIIPFEIEYTSTFRDLNVEWIEKYFVMEPSDYEILYNPNKYIIEKGGHILVAIHGDETVGVCALISSDDKAYDYELSKMAISRNHRGKGIGLLLCQAIIEKARRVNSKAIYLESNTVLEPAINLYRKLGFVEVTDFKSTYSRSNIKMELIFIA